MTRAFTTPVEGSSQMLVDGVLVDFSACRLRPCTFASITKLLSRLHVDQLACPSVYQRCPMLLHAALAARVAEAMGSAASWRLTVDARVVALYAALHRVGEIFTGPIEPRYLVGLRTLMADMAGEGYLAVLEDLGLPRPNPAVLEVVEIANVVVERALRQANESPWDISEHRFMLDRLPGLSKRGLLRLQRLAHVALRDHEDAPDELEWGSDDSDLDWAYEPLSMPVRGWDQKVWRRATTPTLVLVSMDDELIDQMDPTTVLHGNLPGFLKGKYGDDFSFHELRRHGAKWWSVRAGQIYARDRALQVAS